MYIQIETFMYAIMSQKKQSAKHQTVMPLRICENSNSSQEVKLQVKFQVKKHPLTVDTDTLACEQALLFGQAKRAS